MRDKNEDFLNTLKFTEREKHYFDENCKLSKRNKILIISLTLTIILSIGLNLYLVAGYKSREKFIETNFNSIISLSKRYIGESYSDMQLAERAEDENSKVRLLLRVQNKLDIVADIIGQYSNYYTFRSKDNMFYSGNGYAVDFFDSYSGVIKDWVLAIQSDDTKNIPTMESMRDFISDLENITVKFSVYKSVDNINVTPIKNLDYDQLRDLFIKLAKETKTEEVKDNLEGNILYGIKD